MTREGSQLLVAWGWGGAREGLLCKLWTLGDYDVTVKIHELNFPR